MLQLCERIGQFYTSELLKFLCKETASSASEGHIGQRHRENHEMPPRVEAPKAVPVNISTVSSPLGSARCPLSWQR